MNLLFENVKTHTFNDKSSETKADNSSNEKNKFMDKSDFKAQDKMNYFKVDGSFLK